jgi:hypothetical protein
MLALLLVESRDWVREADPGNLDAEVLDMAIDAVVRLRADLVRDGAR